MRSRKTLDNNDLNQVNLFEPWLKHQTFTKVLGRTRYFSEPRFNEPLRHEVLGTANDFLHHSIGKIYEKETSF